MDCQISNVVHRHKLEERRTIILDINVNKDRLILRVALKKTIVFCKKNIKLIMNFHKNRTYL